MEGMRRNRRIYTKLLGLLLALLLLAGCAGPADSPETKAAQTTAAPISSQTPPQDTSAPESSAPEAAKYAADYALLWDTLEQDYPYLDYLRGKGIDVDGIRAKYEAKLEDAATSKDMAAIVESIFRELQNTAHLGLVSPEEFPFYYALYTDEEALSFRKAWNETVLQAAKAGYYSLPEADEPQQPGIYQNLPPVKVSYYPDCKLLCLSIRTFLPDIVDRDRDVLKNALEKYPEAEHLVFDISLNSGGDDRYWRQNLVAPFGEDYLYPMRMFCKDSPRNRRVLEDFGGYLRTEELKDAPAWAKELGLELCFQDDSTVQGTPEVHSDAKRWLLVGPNVYSSAEMFVDFCKATGWATVVGTHTAGDGIGFDPVLTLLPDSGLLFRFSMVAGEASGGAMSLEGTEPELVLPGAGVSHLLDYLRKQGKD